MQANEIEQRLMLMLGELERQPEVGDLFPDELQGFDDQMRQVREYLQVGESSIAYQCLVSLLELFPFQLSGQAAVGLLDVGLTFGFKSERLEDATYDRRNEP